MEVVKKPETKFKEKVEKELKTIPKCWFVKIQQVAKHGTPDILMCINGVFIAIELKTDIGKVDKLQAWTLDNIANAGGLAFVLTPKNFESTIKLLREIYEETKKGEDNDRSNRITSRDSSELQ